MQMQAASAIADTRAAATRQASARPPRPPVHTPLAMRSASRPLAHCRRPRTSSRTRARVPHVGPWAPRSPATCTFTVSSSTTVRAHANRGRRLPSGHRDRWAGRCRGASMLRRLFLASFVRRGLLAPDDAEAMAQWAHGGAFSVDGSVRIEAAYRRDAGPVAADRDHRRAAAADLDRVMARKLGARLIIRGSIDRRRARSTEPNAATSGLTCTRHDNDRA